MPSPDREYLDELSRSIRAAQPPARGPYIDGVRQNLDAGLAIYRNNVRTSLLRAFGERFPVLEKLVGAAFFKFLAAEYFNAHPPTSPLVSRYGDALPAFIESFEPARGFPYLADIARLEIAWLEAYHAADATPLAPSAVAGAGDPAQLQFSLHPSVRLLSSQYPVATIWRRNRDYGKAGANSPARSERVLIARPHRDVFVHTLERGVFCAISEIAKGVCVEEALAAGIESDASFDPQIFFGAMFAYEIIIAVTVNNRPDNEGEGAKK